MASNKIKFKLPTTRSLGKTDEHETNEDEINLCGTFSYINDTFPTQ